MKSQLVEPSDFLRRAADHQLQAKEENQEGKPDNYAATTTRKLMMSFRMIFMRLLFSFSLMVS